MQVNLQSISVEPGDATRYEIVYARTEEQNPELLFCCSLGSGEQAHWIKMQYFFPVMSFGYFREKIPVKSTHTAYIYFRILLHLLGQRPWPDDEWKDLDERLKPDWLDKIPRPWVEVAK